MQRTATEALFSQTLSNDTLATIFSATQVQCILPAEGLHPMIVVTPA